MVTARQANRRYFRLAYQTGRHGWETQEPSAYMVRFLRRVIRLAGRGRLLDVGCGEGRHALAAARMGFAVTALDYEPLALKRARRLARSRRAVGIRFLQADFLAGRLPRGRFDVVLDSGCLHHQRKADWPAYRAALLRVLRPGDFYVLMVFSPAFGMFGRRRRKWHIAQGAYRRCFTRKEILRMFRQDFGVLSLLQEKGKGRGFWYALMRRRPQAG
jgi:SAM-dependent methyltransferase